MRGGVRALIVDFGGVLTTSVFESFRSFCLEHEVDPQLLKSVLVGGGSGDDEPPADHWVYKLESGEITTDEFNRLLAEGLNAGRESPIEAAGLKDRLFANCAPAPEMFDLVRTVKEAGYRTALLSNSWGGDGYPHELFLEIFDAVVLSGEVRMRKPQAEIYLHAARAIGCEPSECVFVDDFKVNVEGAERAGMQAIHHTDPDRTRRQVLEIFGLELQPEEASG